VIVATSQAELEAAYSVTRTVPIVARMSDDPVRTGMARTLFSPEGNVTGFFSHFEEMASVRLTQLNRAVPNLHKVGVLLTIHHGDSAFWLTQARGAADKLGLETYVMNVNKEGDLETVFAKARENGVGGILAFRSPIVASFDRRVIELSNSHQLPGIFDARDYVELGAFMSYGPNVQTTFRELAPYVARIMKGETPATLPIGQPRGFEMVLNLRTARLFGFTVPPSVVTSANLVME
jgi:putative ABC transport system substrate-binding protein